MKDNFAACLPLVLKYEGGYVNNPNDPGGPTNKGITLDTFRRFVDKNGSVDDLKRLTAEQAGKVYRAQYWDAVRGDDLPYGLDFAVFDFAVNSGPDRAVKYLQRLAKVDNDGVFGPETLDAVIKVNPSSLINGICNSRLTFLRALKTWAYFGKGWQSRVDNVRTVALGMTAVKVITPDMPPVVDKPGMSVFATLMSVLSLLFVKK